MLILGNSAVIVGAILLIFTMLWFVGLGIEDVPEKLGILAGVAMGLIIVGLLLIGFSTPETTMNPNTNPGNAVLYTY